MMTIVHFIAKSIDCLHMNYFLNETLYIKLPLG